MQSMYQLFDKQGVCWGYVLIVAVWLSTHYSCGGVGLITEVDSHYLTC